MRSSRRSKTQKKPYRHPRINKKKYKNKSRCSWGWNDDISGLFLDNINEVLRENKSRRAEGKGSWKVMPKDSCEVYKDRQKRSNSNRRRQENNEEASDDTESQMEEDKKLKKKPRRKNQKKKMPPKKIILKKKNRRRSYSSSYSSGTSYSSVTTSYSTLSEKEMNE